jgi:hypothetical protein
VTKEKDDFFIACERMFLLLEERCGTAFLEEAKKSQS